MKLSGRPSALSLLLVSLVGACGGTPPAAAPEPVPEPGPAEEAAPQAAEPEPVVAAPTAPAPEPAPLVLDATVQKLALPGGRGTLVLGASACNKGSRQLLAQLTKADGTTAQADLAVVTGCEFTKDGKGYKSRDLSEAEPQDVRFELSTLVLDAKTTAVLVAVTRPFDDEGVLLLARAGTLEPVGLGRASDTQYQYLLQPAGQLTRTHRTYRGGGAYGAYALGLGADGNVVEGKPRETWLARAEKHPDVKGVEAAADALVERCPKLGGRIQPVEVPAGEASEYWLGVPSFVRADVTRAISELRACGVTATAVKLPLSE